MFLRYPHLEKYGNTATENIEFGTTYIFPKLDGTNAQVWFLDYHEGQCDSTIQLGTGSHPRSLHTSDNDNAGFNKFVQDQCHYAGEGDGPLANFFHVSEHQKLQLYGEWLVPHTVKHYHEHAWRKFYVFDVFDSTNQRFLPYEVYQPLMEQFGIDYVPCIKKIQHGTWENFLHEAKSCRYLLKEEDPPPGEGIVIKNYDIPRSLHTVYYSVVTEELWDCLKKLNGHSLVNFKELQQLCIQKVKTTKPELF